LSPTVWRLVPAFLSVVLISACSRPVIELDLITPNQGTDREIAEDLAAFASEHSRVHIRLIPEPAGGQAILDALEEGYGDIAFASNDQPWREDVTTILPLYPTVLHMVVREELLEREFVDMIRGAKIFAGPAGSASRLLVQNILSDLSIDSEEVRYLAPEDGVPPDVVVIYAAIQPGRVREQMKDLPLSYRMLPFGEPADIGSGGNIDRVTLLNPRVRPFVIPVGTYGDVTPEPIVTVAVDKLLVSRADLSDPAAHDLIEEIFRMRPGLSGRKPSIFASLSEDFDPNGHTFALHPGARAYLDRNEPSWAERYSGIGEVLVGLMVALVSGSFAAVNIYNRKRKNRIDVFYKQVFAELERIDKSSSTADRQAAVDRLRELQKSAFDMLVKEKLAADESFRIFITLSNDAIDELTGATPRRGI